MTPAGFRVHVGHRRYPDHTFLLLDVFDVATPAEAKAQARKVRYCVTREDGALWLAALPFDCDVEVAEWECPDAVWEDIADEVTGDLLFTCNEDDAL